MKSNFITLAWLIIGLSYVCGMCSKEPSVNNNSNQDTSAAGKIAGTFNGTGKKMPQGISLGTYAGCIAPGGWANNFQTGSSTVTVTKVTDNSINISISGGPLAPANYPNISVTESGGIISFSLGSYSINTKSLNISINAGTYLITNACLQGLPYYSGYSILGNNTYTYQTIGHIDFSGTK